METSIILERNVQIPVCSQWGLTAAQPRNQLCGPLLGLGVAEIAKLGLSLPLHDTVTGGWHLTHRLHFPSPLTFRWEHTISSHQWNVSASDVSPPGWKAVKQGFLQHSLLFATY